MRGLGLLLQFCGAAQMAAAQPPQPPTLTPQLPTPFLSTAHLPIALHAANETGMYSQAAVEQMAKYDMVTIEKWYTLCGAKHPTQGTPACNVEAKFYETFNAIHKINPR